MNSNPINRRIGFMQGRLSEMVDGKIQAFPWSSWQDEFQTAYENDFNLMEWTLDQDRLYENPLMTKAGRAGIQKLMETYDLQIPSLTGDCFMQAPFYKASGTKKEELLDDLKNIIKACSQLGIPSVLIPLVDHGKLENKEQKSELVKDLSGIAPVLEKNRMKILFESDYAPEPLGSFIRLFDEEFFGLTYDIGNSASLGYGFKEEFDCYFNRILNVHVKDRLLGGTTVPLGEGDADLPGALHALNERGYKGNYILQTARAQDGNHSRVLCDYRDMVAGWLDLHPSTK